MGNNVTLLTLRLNGMKSIHTNPENSILPSTPNAYSTHPLFTGPLFLLLPSFLLPLSIWPVEMQFIPKPDYVQTRVKMRKGKVKGASKPFHSSIHAQPSPMQHPQSSKMFMARRETRPQSPFVTTWSYTITKPIACCRTHTQPRRQR